MCKKRDYFKTYIILFIFISQLKSSCSGKYWISSYKHHILKSGCRLRFSLDEFQRNSITWCTISEEEQRKCIEISEKVIEKASEFGAEYREVKCTRGTNKENCMSIIDQEMADITSVDAGLVYIASRYYSLIPIMQEASSQYFKRMLTKTNQSCGDRCMEIGRLITSALHS